MIRRNQMLAFASLSSLAIGLCASPAFAQDQVPAGTGTEGADRCSGIRRTTAKLSSPRRSAPRTSRTCRSRSPPSPAIRLRGTMSSMSRAWPRSLRTSASPRARRRHTSALQSAASALRATPTVEPSVAVFLDGAYVPARRRGHQLDAGHGKRRSAARPAGHFFGRNASVGAVSFHTARPKFGDFGG